MWNQISLSRFFRLSRCHVFHNRCSPCDSAWCDSRRHAIRCGLLGPLLFRRLCPCVTVGRAISQECLHPHPRAAEGPLELDCTTIIAMAMRGRKILPNSLFSPGLIPFLEPQRRAILWICKYPRRLPSLTQLYKNPPILSRTVFFVGFQPLR